MKEYIIDIDQERKEILKKYKQLIALLRNRATQEQKREIRKAFNLAVLGHKDMRRKSGEPYIYHPIEVARIVVADIGLGATATICALLHDLVEDTDYTLKDVEKLFGSNVAKIIDGLTKIDDVMDMQTPSLQAENFRKILMTLSDDVRVILIKLADRLHNMRTLESMPRDKQLKIASETAFLYAPLAHRLGLYSFKTELDDLSMKYLEPEVFQNISRQISESKEERDLFIKAFTQPIDKILEKEGLEFEIVSRVKSIRSIWNKMRKKGVPFEEVYDLFAIRIIVDSPVEREKVDCWKVYTVVTSLYRPNPDRLRDWISIPKANGYESLHTTVMSSAGKWVEVQIRSRRMDEIAEKGYAAHWKYKNLSHADQKFEAGVDEWLEKIRDILKSDEITALDFLSEIKSNLFTDEIFVFTPKGEMKTMPKGSTVIDFAYTVHTELGNSCIGAKVNYSLMPIKHVLKSGDQVEVITSKVQKPRADWLDFVITSKARNRINNALKIDKKTQTEEGRLRFVKYLSENNMSYSEELLQDISQRIGFKDKNDFLYAFNNDEISFLDLKRSFEAEKPKKMSFVDYITLRPLINLMSNTKNVDEAINLQMKKDPTAMVLDENIQEVNYVIADCCNPLAGDPVVGFIKDSNLIKIHRTTCKVAISKMSQHGNLIVKAKWKNKEKVSILTGLRVTGIDTMGLMKRIFDVISTELKINVRSVEFETSEGSFTGTVYLYLHELEVLMILMEKLKKLDGVDKVIRINSYKK
ncbi:MAG: bifunctional (p)ppGpp synthetase/guanosine-3',5'-bis(diphosphate) 3'-pyrophosphohydrolase [Bacteroidales bacterium]|nr:bifunctional (p)ppGpp synthetase/guanosine-3',5'-bis(diphosphate) 3'-pyrophosphohydrolase [Bacteroidales bacterium]